MDHAFYDLTVDLWAHISALSKHHIQSSDQLLLRLGLQKITSSAGAKSRPHQIRGFVQSEQNDLHIGLRLAYRASGLDAVQPGHRNVHDDDVRFQLVSQADGIISVVRFSAKLPL